MSVMANGWGSREKARSSLKRRQPVSKQDENSMALSTVVQSDEEIVDVKPLAVCSGSPEIGVSKRSIIRLYFFLFLSEAAFCYFHKIVFHDGFFLYVSMIAQKPDKKLSI